MLCFDVNRRCLENCNAQPRRFHRRDLSEHVRAVTMVLILPPRIRPWLNQNEWLRSSFEHADDNHLISGCVEMHWLQHVLGSHDPSLIGGGVKRTNHYISVEALFTPSNVAKASPKACFRDNISIAHLLCFKVFA